MDCPKQMSNRIRLAMNIDSIRLYRIYFPQIGPLVPPPPGARHEMDQARGRFQKVMQNRVRKNRTKLSMNVLVLILF